MQYQNKHLEEILVKEEEIRRYVYVDSLGYETIGIGRCIAPGKKGLSVEESYYLMRNDIAERYGSLIKLEWFNKLDEPRQLVILEMAFIFGFEGMLEFKKMITALIHRDYEQAAREMLDSKWAKHQAQARANRMASRMISGKYPT